MTSGGLSEAQLKARGELRPIKPARLFAVSCVALTCGSMMFAIFGDIRLGLKHDFILTNEDVGWIASAGTGFMVAMFLFGPLCDVLGMKWLLRLAFLLQTGGLVLMIMAEGPVWLFLGLLVNSLGSGAVEAVCNPLIATIYPDKKTQKLSQFHMWFPGGIVIGSAACYVLTQAGLDLWRLKLALAVLPALAYGVMLIGLDFPKTERVQAGVTFGGMWKETFLRPLFLMLLGCMLLTASLELGPMGWIPAVFSAGGMPGILILMEITILMAVLRFVAGPVVRTLTNPGVLLLAAVVGGTGLLLLSFPMGVYGVMGVAAVFAVGVAYFWPTMLGTVAERVPKGGALALAIIGGTGSCFVSVVTQPEMGRLADQYLQQELVLKGTVDGQPVDKTQTTLAVLRDVHTSFKEWQDSLRDSPRDRATRKDIQPVLNEVGRVLEAYDHAGQLPAAAAARALRTAIKNAPTEKGERAEVEEEALSACNRAVKLLNPADYKGGLMSFRYVTPVAGVLIVIFGILLLKDRRRGGYRPDRISAGPGR